MEEPSSPLDFDWDAIDAELDEKEDGNTVRSDSSPHVIPDLTSQDPGGTFQRLQQRRDASEDRAGYCSDEERTRANPAGSMAIFNDIVKDTIEHAIPGRQRIFPTEPAKKFSYSADIEKFSGLRITDRAVSSPKVNSILSDLRFVRLQGIKTVMTRDKIVGSWATVGVIVEKGVPRQSAKGKNFVVWKLGTLEKSCLSLFLFGAAYTEHWKEPLGSIIAILNANVRPDGKSREPSLSVFKVEQVMKLGTSVDYRVCSGRRKDGTPCSMVLNKRDIRMENQSIMLIIKLCGKQIEVHRVAVAWNTQNLENLKRQLQGQYCQYHATAAHQEFRTTRPELNGGKLALAGPGIRKGYPTKLVRSPTKDEVFKGSLKHITTSELKDLLSDAEKMPTKSHSQGKRFLEVMAERTSGLKVIANKGVKRSKSLDASNARKRTPSAAKQMNTKSPGVKDVPHSATFERKSKSNGVVMEIDTLDDLNDSMIHATSNFKR